MARKIIYWVITGLLAPLSVFAAFTYLSGSPQAVQGFAHVGYPQQLRIILGIAKLLRGITLVAPGLPTLKEWAYAGFTFAWTIGICGALSGQRWREGVDSADTADTPLRVLCDPADESPMATQSRGGVISSRTACPAPR